MTHYTTVQQIEEANRKSGGHWFDADTMRAFKSRVGTRVENINGRTFFVSSERQTAMWSGINYPRLYTVREVTESGDIRSVSRFQQFRHARDAWYWLFHDPASGLQPKEAA